MTEQEKKQREENIRIRNKMPDNIDEWKDHIRLKDYICKLNYELAIAIHKYDEMTKK